MDYTWIIGLVTALGASASGILVGLAQLRKVNIPQSELLMLLRSLWDWVVITGQEFDVPRHIRVDAWEKLKRGPDDDEGTDSEKLGPVGSGQRTGDRHVDHDRHVRNPDG